MDESNLTILLFQQSIEIIHQGRSRHYVDDSKPRENSHSYLHYVISVSYCKFIISVSISYTAFVLKISCTVIIRIIR